MSLRVSSLEPLLPRLSLRMRIAVFSSFALDLTFSVGYIIHENTIGRDPFDWVMNMTERTPTFIVATISLLYHLVILMVETFRNGWRAHRARHHLDASEERAEHLLGQSADPRVTSSAYSSIPAIALAWLVSASWLAPIGIYGYQLVSEGGFPDGQPPVWMAIIALVMQVGALAALVCTTTFAMHERRYGARAIYLP